MISFMYCVLATVKKIGSYMLNDVDLGLDQTFD